MKERLIAVYEAARENPEVDRRWYLDYCNTRISATVKTEYVVEVVRYRRVRPESETFDVRNVSANAFLNRVARWLVAGEETATSGPSDPLEW